MYARIEKKIRETRERQGRREEEVKGIRLIACEPLESGGNEGTLVPYKHRVDNEYDKLEEEGEEWLNYTLGERSRHNRRVG